MAATRAARSAALPDFPWDLLAPAKKRAAAHPGGLIDLSIGTPVDPVPTVIREALAAASDAPGYPLAAGSPTLRAAIGEYAARRCGAGDGVGVLPTIGSKELVGWLPILLGLGPGDTVAIPSVCYPTYEVGARMAGASVARAGSPAELDAIDGPVGLIWINSPGNPNGRVLPAAELAAVVAWARAHGAVVASDECYLELTYDGGPTPVSALDPAVRGDALDGVIAVHSLSKRSNLAGYRAGFVAGDPAVVAELLAVRRHLGMLMPAPVQAAMVAALSDQAHAEEQRQRYAARREVLRAALTGAGLRIEDSAAGLYLWATRDEDCWTTVDWLAGRGILASPGAFYGPAGVRHMRFALTASDERIGAVAARLSSVS
ncbi:bifunctional succinyldiaminopimelate transaminase/glutamate-prephenate aminotransferase [Luedemannella flava]|uniref:Aminotransferase n=1 Tax=Luedemannella flava TaxID=349316 RepID=A0ABP4YDE0_9ACTN